MLRVLSLTGGGYFGLYTASLLSHLEDLMARPYHEQFDCIIGTSIGGVIGLCLSIGMPAKAIQNLMLKHGPDIFYGRRHYKRYRIFQDLIKPFLSVKYSNQPMYRVLEQVFLDKPFDAAGCMVIIPVYNVQRCKPHLFQAIAKPGHKPNGTIKMLDVAMAASAAPLLFPLYEVNETLYMDAAAYACSPDLIALDALHYNMGVPLHELHMLSVGSATAHPIFTQFMHTKVSGLRWQNRQRLWLTQLAAQQQQVVNMARHQLGPNYIRLDNNCKVYEQNALGTDIPTAQATSILLRLAEETYKKAKDHELLRHLIKSS